MKLTIDGRQVEACDGATVMEVARGAGVKIPALCYHPAVAPYGACRLCLVEATHGGRTRVVTACCYPARDGLDVLTNSERIRRARRGVMELLLARAPESPVLREMAAEMGVTGGRLPTIARAEGDCILCGLCVSVCREVMGAAAISFANRGMERVVAAPFLQPSEACLGCGACAVVCPVGAIEVQWGETEVEVKPFGNRVAPARCSECRAPIGGLPFSERLERELGGRLVHTLSLCTSCKQRHAAASASKAGRARTLAGGTASSPT